MGIYHNDYCRKKKEVMVSNTNGELEIRPNVSLIKEILESENKIRFAFIKKDQLEDQLKNDNFIFNASSTFAFSLVALSTFGFLGLQFLENDHTKFLLQNYTAISTLTAVSINESFRFSQSMRLKKTKILLDATKSVLEDLKIERDTLNRNSLKSFISKEKLELRPEFQVAEVIDRVEAKLLELYKNK